MPFSGLKTLGFTDSDILVYEFLVREGESDKGAVAKGTGIAVDRLDEILSRLVSYGAIEMAGNIVSPVSPKAFLNRHLRKKEIELELQMAELKNAANELQSMLEPIYSEKKYGLRLEEIFQTFEGLPLMEMETVKMVSRSRQEINIFVERFNWYYKVREELISALDRRVKVKVLLLTYSDENRERVEDMKRIGIEVRRVEGEWRNTRFTISDKSELVFLFWASKTGDSRIYYRPGYTKNPGMVCVFADAFEHLWEKASPL